MIPLIIDVGPYSPIQSRFITCQVQRAGKQNPNVFRIPVHDMFVYWADHRCKCGWAVAGVESGSVPEYLFHFVPGLEVQVGSGFYCSDIVFLEHGLREGPTADLC